MIQRRRNRIQILLGFLALACVSAWAQANSELTGIVTDQTGAVVPDAKIVLTDPGTGASKTTASGSTGLYDISGLNPANYNLKVTAKGFESYAQTGIVVNVSTTSRADIKLTVGAETQTVTVEADALAVQADSNVVSTLISSEQISQIATENRNFAALAALGLGVSSAVPDSNTPTSVAANFSISVNGLRENHNIWLIDGGEADDRGGAGGMSIMPSQDAIAEFTMMTSNYPPDYGISSGATMSLSLKSGTQKFHGEVFEFNRNTDYDANNYFNKLTTPATPATSTHYNIFGGNVGGPVYIPHVYNANKQKTFFFWNEEWRKILTGAGTNEQPTIDPADIPKAGQNLTYVAPLFKPSTSLVVPVVGDPAFNAKLAADGLTPGSAFPNNIIPANLFDPNGVLYLNSGILPPANVPGQDKNITNVSNPIDVVDTVVRIDHKFNDKWTILGHYLEDKVTQGYAQPELGWLWASYNTVTSTLQNPSDSAAIKLSGTINPNLLVEASINYDGNVINILDSKLANKPSGWSVSTFFNTGNPYLPGVTGFGNPYGTAEDMGSAPWHNAARDYEPKVDISYTMGKHAMKYGFSYNRYTKNQQLFGDAEGDVGQGQLTNDGLMDLLLGLSSSYSQYQAVPVRHYVNQTPSAYALDNWHVSPRLTLQLGLRYDALPHAWERSNQVANFDPSLYLASEQPTWIGTALNPNGPGFQTVNGTPFYVNGMGLAGQNGFPRGLVENDYNTLQPRVGFSEDLFGTGKTVLRGGLGTFYERLQGNDIYNAATAPPFAFNPSASNVYFSNPSTSWQTGQTASTPFFPSGGWDNLNQSYKAPAVAQFSLGLQHEVKPSLIWVIQYVGNLAWHQSIVRDINNYPLSTPLSIRAQAGDGGCKYAGDQIGGGNTNCNPAIDGGNLANPALYRSYQGYGQIKQEENDTNGNYNGFQTGLRVQNRWGLSGEIDYTYSHEIDLTSADIAEVSNPFNPKYDKGSGNLDRRHIVNANYVYNLPFFAKSAGLTHSLLGGWELAGTFIDESGIPNTSGGLNVQGPGLTLPYDPVGLGGPGAGYLDRPNVSGKVSYPKKFGQWFNTAQFSAPTPAWLGGPNQGFGNAARDAIVGPGRVNFTTSLYKSFAMTERAHLELRFESFNTFNHTEFYNYNASLNSSQFGQITSTWDPRVLELGGKFVF